MALNSPVPSVDFDVLQRNMQDADKFVNSTDLSFANRPAPNGKTTTKTLDGIIDEADTVIDGYRAAYIGDYVAPDKQFTTKGQFVVWAVNNGGDGSAYVYIGPDSGLPYTTDIALHPNPNSDPQLQVNPIATPEYVQEQSHTGDEQVTGLNIWPANAKHSASVGDTGLVDISLLRDASSNTLYKTSELVSGNITAIDFLLKTATVGGVSVTLSDFSIEQNSQDIEQINQNTVSVFYKSLYQEPAFRLNVAVLEVNGDIAVTVEDNVLRYSDGDIVTLPVMLLGTDYAIYATENGLIVSDNFTVPLGYNANNSRRIGGFHHQDGFINDYSIWDLRYKPACDDPRGMSRSFMGFWADLYLLNTTPDLLGTSAYNAQIADGGSTPKIPEKWGGDGIAQYPVFIQYIATEVLAAYGKRLPNQHEFSVLAQGSVTGYAIGNDPIKTMFDVSARSLIGCEQVSGHMWQWGSECSDRGNGSSGYGWQSVDTDNKGQVFASGAQGVSAPRFGAHWGDAGDAGSRASNWDHSPWTSTIDFAARGICDHCQSL